jgi:hypothetical protein
VPHQHPSTDKTFRSSEAVSYTSRSHDVVIGRYRWSSTAGESELRLANISSPGTDAHDGEHECSDISISKVDALG